jgi:hypothetical protein
MILAVCVLSDGEGDKKLAGKVGYLVEKVEKSVGNSEKNGFH